MRKLILFMHVSLDGFVAGPSGEMNWIKVDDEIFDYAGDETDKADTALYGRVTYEMMDSYWPTAADQPNAGKHEKHHGAWYKAVNKVVMSTSLQTTDPKVQVLANNIAEGINKLKAMEGRNIIIFGSPGAAHSLMEEALIDEYWLFINPILLGEGTPLFKNIRQKTALKILENRSFKSGVVCLHYSKV